MWGLDVGVGRKPFFPEAQLVETEPGSSKVPAVIPQVPHDMCAGKSHGLSSFWLSARLNEWP